MEINPAGGSGGLPAAGAGGKITGAAAGGGLGSSWGWPDSPLEAAMGRPGKLLKTRRNLCYPASRENIWLQKEEALRG
jgi:hypothetical protein